MREGEGQIDGCVHEDERGMRGVSRGKGRSTSSASSTIVDERGISWTKDFMLILRGQ